MANTEQLGEMLRDINNKLVAVGDAIREKTGGSNELSLANMPQAIASISGGGGVGGYDPVLENNSWEDIIRACDSNEIPNEWKVGDTKLLDLGANGILHMQIVGLGVDELADGTGYAKISWLSSELLFTGHRYNPQEKKNADGTYQEGTGTIGGWEKSEMRAYLKDTVKSFIPETVRNRIVEVNKYSNIFNVAGELVKDEKTADDLWIPSAHEIFSTSSIFETKGPTYYSGDYNTADALKKTRVQTNGASFYAWWTRTAYTFSQNAIINSSGGAKAWMVTETEYMPLGFCL